LNETVPLRPVEPLYCTLLSHKLLLSPLVIDFCSQIPGESFALTTPLQGKQSSFFRPLLRDLEFRKKKSSDTIQNKRERLEPSMIAEILDEWHRTSTQRSTRDSKLKQRAAHIIQEHTFCARKIYELKRFLANDRRSPQRYLAIRQDRIRASL
jgi:hypothetical protein